MTIGISCLIKVLKICETRRLRQSAICWHQFYSCCLLSLAEHLMNLVLWLQDASSACLQQKLAGQSWWAFQDAWLLQEEG